MYLPRLFSLVLLLASVVPTVANAAQSVRFGSALIVVGDTEAKVLAVAGKPAARSAIKATRTQYQGSRLQFIEGNRTIIIDIRDGKVTRIDHKG
ncbi:DUF2845 domain-containing protein [Pinirhizobacter soli]|uniref:DUF2845 domain-containing protein n=1 Tax=Pinirhizobacter soli TaxID=2786953 RepID=UPI002029FD13|nr:DUF2845 domain-containing protein [Pinirhizobacter soli]